MLQIALLGISLWVGGQNVPHAGAPINSPTSVKFTIAEHDLYPESIAFDPDSGDYFLSSMSHPRILRIHADGSYEDFLSEKIESLASSIGMKVDAKRRALWVCTGRFSLLADFNAITPRTGVLRFDIDSGKLLQSWMLEQETPYHIFNDIVLTAKGEAFATTTSLGRIYKLTPGVEAMDIVQQLDSGSHNNGIVLGPEERFLFVTVDRRIHRIDLMSGEVAALEVPDDEALGTDGLYFHDNSLILVKPRYKKISRIFLGDDLQTVSRVETLVGNHPDLAYPTTGVLVGNSLVYVATSFADSPRTNDPGPQHTDVLIHEIPLTDQ